MPLFRKKALVIRAEQFDGVNGVPGVYWEVPIANASGVCAESRPYVVTIHRQRAYLEIGDWVVPEPDGKHYYPVKDDVMRQNYDRVEENSGVSSEEVLAMRMRARAGLTPSQILTPEGLARLLDEIIAHRGIA